MPTENAGATVSAIACVIALAVSSARAGYRVCTSNERSGDVTVIDGSSGRVLATIPVGKRPRGIHASPDGRYLYVALSGRPIEGPPQLDSHGNPILHKDEDDDANSDHSADGIGVVDLHEMKFLRKLPGGSDPEQFAVSPDGKYLFIADEDVATMSMVNVNDGRVEHIVRVGKEPEGVGVTPDGKLVYVTCETSGEIFVIDIATHKSIAHFVVGGRPRSVAFTPDGALAVIPSESAQQLHLIDARAHKEMKTVQLPQGFRPMGTAMSADGKQLYVTTGRGGTMCVVDPATLSILKVVKVGGRPWGVAVSPDGKLAYTADGPTNEVAVIDIEQGKVINRIHAGQSPWGVTVVP